MNLSTVQAILHEAITTSLLVVGPMLVVTSVIGIAISLLQAVTQLQESSLSFIPKLVAAGVMLLTMGSWMLQTLVSFVIRMIGGPASI